MASHCIVLARRMESGDRAAALKCQKGKHEPKPQLQACHLAAAAMKAAVRKRPQHWEISSPPPTDVRNLHRYRYAAGLSPVGPPVGSVLGLNTNRVDKWYCRSTSSGRRALTFRLTSWKVCRCKKGAVSAVQSVGPRRSTRCQFIIVTCGMCRRWTEVASPPSLGFRELGSDGGVMNRLSIDRHRSRAARTARGAGTPL